MKFLISSILILFSIFSLGNTQYENFTSFNTGNGRLTHNSVEAIARDSFGYVWLGTSFGLNRLDGYQTQNFLNDPNNPNSISSNFIVALFVDSENELWIGTIGGGLNKFDRKTNNFTHYIPNGSSESISSLNISAIAEDKSGNIWIGTIGNGVNRFNKKTGKFKKFNLEEYDPEHRTNSNVNILFCDKDGNIWVGLNQSDIFKIDTESEKITFYGLTKSDPRYSEVGSIKGITQLKDGTLLVAGWGGNVYKLNPATDNHISIFADKSFFNKNSLTDITVDSKDNIWISTWGNGVYKLDCNKKDTQLFQNNQYQINSLGSNSVNALYVDWSDNLWVGFTDNGVSMLSLREKIFKTLPIQPKNSSIPVDYNVYSIVRDKNNNLWIGTRGQGLIKYNLKTSETKFFTAEKHPGLNRNSVLTLKVNPEGNIWIGTDGSFISLLDPTTEKITHIPNQIDDWSAAVFCIAENEQFLWGGTWGGGIKRVDKKTLKYTSINFDDKDQFRNSIFDIELRDSLLWITDIGIGLIKYNIYTGVKKIFSQTEGFTDFPKERIIDIMFENDTTCCLSTDGAGLYCFNPFTEKIESYNKKYPLAGCILQSTITDNYGNLWIASISGISCINRSTGKCYNFDKSNGLINNQLNKSALFFDPVDNIIYVGGAKGVNYFNPTKIVIDSISNKVVITDFKIMGKSVFPDSKNTAFPIDITNEVNLFRKDKVITIHFSSLEFNPSSKNEYLYMLEGFEKEWNETSFSKNFVQYTNLFPGTYHFKVRAVNNDGIISDQTTSLEIIVHPAFWQTLLFKIFVILLLILLIILYFKNQYKSLISSKILLENKVVERTAEIQKQKEKIEQQNQLLEQANQSKDKFFSIISHDLRNPVTTMDQMAELIIMKYNHVPEEKMMNYLQLLKRTSAGTLELLDDLLIWARTQTNRIEINKTNLHVQEVLNHIFNICQPIAEKKNVEILLPPPTELQVYADKFSVHTTLRNLVTNAIKFSNPYNYVTITLEETSEIVVFHISDTGIGMRDEEVRKLFKVEKMHSKQGTAGETGSGLGLVLCHEFLTLNGGSIWVESKLGEGSIFSFSLKKA